MVLGIAVTPALGFTYQKITWTFHAVPNGQTAQGIVTLSTNDAQQMADVSWYLRRLAPGMQYRISINVRNCGNTTGPADERVLGYKLTADDEGEVWAITGHEMTHGFTSSRPSFSVWEGWTGTERRACVNGFHLHVNPFQLDVRTAATDGCQWQNIIATAQVKGQYVGRCTDAGGKDALYIDVPAANHRYRITINSHGCATNAPNQDLVRQFKATSDKYAAIFRGEIVTLEPDQVVQGPFTLSVYDGWNGNQRIACGPKGWSFVDVNA
jgi:hypothetical protein